MFSKTTEYALRATIFIAQKSSAEQKLGINEIASAINSPPSFTAKILQKLTRNQHIVCSIRGPGGGFYMTEKERSLPVSNVLIAMDEARQLKKCILGLTQCSEVQPCPLHVHYKSIRQQLEILFENKTIGELADEIGIRKVCIGI